MNLALLPRTEQLNPPLKWAGGKRWLVPILQEIWREHCTSRLVEPFVGGMAIALGLQPKVALLNDLNAHLINFYSWLKKGLLIEILLDNDSDYYYNCRLRFNQLVLNGQGNTVEAASLFYFMNRTGYNGLCRFNSRNQFNVPFGRYKKINYTRNFLPYTAVCQSFQFTAQDFTQLDLDTKDFIYADPPYDVEFTRYSASDFTWQDQIRLAEWLAQHRGAVVASNQATDRIVKLYRQLGFSLRFLDAPRRIACNGDRAPAREILAYKGL